MRGPAPTKGDEMGYRKSRWATVNLDRQLHRRIGNMIQALEKGGSARRTIAGEVEAAVVAHLQEKERMHNGGEPFPAVRWRAKRRVGKKEDRK